MEIIIGILIAVLLLSIRNNQLDNGNNHLSSKAKNRLKNKEKEKAYKLNNTITNNTEKDTLANEKNKVKNTLENNISNWEKINEFREEFVKKDIEGKLIEKILFKINSTGGERILKKEYIYKLNTYKYYKYEKNKKIEINSNQYESLYTRESTLLNKVEVNLTNYTKENKVSKYLDVLHIGLKLKTQTGIPFEIISIYECLKIQNSKGSVVTINKKIMEDYISKKDFYNSRRHYSYEPSIAKYIIERLNENINNSYNTVNSNRKKLQFELHNKNNNLFRERKTNIFKEKDTNKTTFLTFLKEKNIDINNLSKLNKQLISTKVAKDIFSKKVIVEVLSKEDSDSILELSESLKIQIEKQGKQTKSNGKLTYPIRNERWLTDRL